MNTQNSSETFLRHRQENSTKRLRFLRLIASISNQARDTYATRNFELHPSRGMQLDLKKGMRCCSHLAFTSFIFHAEYQSDMGL